MAFVNSVSWLAEFLFLAQRITDAIFVCGVFCYWNKIHYIYN